ncbi:MAG: hypothetical protein ACI4GD_09485 [Lachnospiraceae bacterium]
MLRLISMCGIIMVVGAFALALLVGCAAGYMESHSENKDNQTKNMQESKTWVLLNGCIAVSDRPQGRGGQMIKPYVMNENMPGIEKLTKALNALKQ